MNFVFRKILQFSLLVKAGERVREFNFNESPAENRVRVNVCSETGERIYFTLAKNESGWSIEPAALPGWITRHEKNIVEAFEAELRRGPA